jgi:hypothetical protein
MEDLSRVFEGDNVRVRLFPPALLPYYSAFILPLHKLAWQAVFID